MPSSGLADTARRACVLMRRSSIPRRHWLLARGRLQHVSSAPLGPTAARRSSAAAATPGNRSPPPPRPRHACRMPQATELDAEDLERPGPGGGEPVVGDHAWHHVHLCPELRHIEVVQNVDGAEQHLDWLPDRQVQVVTVDHNVVLPVGIVGIQSQRVVRADVVGIGCAQPAVLTREAESSTATADQRPRTPMPQQER